MIYPSDGFDPSAVLEAAQAERATALYGVPTMFIAELTHPDFAQFDLSSLHTGDLATMDGEGYLNIVGRIKDMIIRGGENVYPREIEKFGEEVMAWIRLRDGQAATAEEIRDYCRGRIAHYKIPRYVKFVDGFPMTVTGKVQKFLMRARPA